MIWSKYEFQRLHFIVYCGDGRLFDGQRDDEIRHIQFVKDRLYNLGIKSSQFTATESMDRRMELVDMFNNNEVASLVAIRCLDEGINIPSIKSALILSSNDDYEDYKHKRSGFVEELTKAKMLVNKCKKDIDKLSSTVSENRIIDRKIEIMEQVKQYFVNILDGKSETYSNKLQESIQELLDAMLEAKRTVSVSKGLDDED